MSASRKDFEAIAAAVRQSFAEDVRETVRVEVLPWERLRRRTVWLLGLALQDTNPRFDYARFTAACGVPSWIDEY